MVNDLKTRLHAGNHTRPHTNLTYSFELDPRYNSLKTSDYLHAGSLPAMESVRLPDTRKPQYPFITVSTLNHVKDPRITQGMFYSLITGCWAFRNLTPSSHRKSHPRIKARSTKGCCIMTKPPSQKCVWGLAVVGFPNHAGFWGLVSFRPIIVPGHHTFDNSPHMRSLQLCKAVV